MRLGASEVSKMYLGTQEVTKAYLGLSQVFSGAPQSYTEAMAQSAPYRWWRLNGAGDGPYTYDEMLGIQAVWDGGGLDRVTSTTEGVYGAAMSDSNLQLPSGLFYNQLDWSIEILLRIPETVQFGWLNYPIVSTGFSAQLFRWTHTPGVETIFHYLADLASGSTATFTWNVGTMFDDHKWHHVACSPTSISGTEDATLWVDGLRYLSPGTGASGMLAASGTTIVGLGQWWVDEPAFYRRRLTSEEVVYHSEFLRAGQ